MGKISERYTVERTFGTVLCECPPQLCRHPEGYREVGEYVVVDGASNAQSDPYDRYREAKAAADDLNLAVEEGGDE